MYILAQNLYFQTSISNAVLDTEARCYCHSESILDDIICR